MASVIKSFRFLALVFLSAYVIKTWCIGVFVVPTTSMEPSIRAGSLITILKLPYVFRTPDMVPFTTIPFSNVHVRTLIRFQKGQIIVFDSPIEPDSHPSSRMTFVKRLSALPGDTLIFTEDRYLSQELAVFASTGVEMVVPYSGMTVTLDSNSFSMWKSTIERDMGRSLSEQEFITEHRFSQDFYYFTGDNPISSDSRNWGLVPASHLRGRVIFSAF
jgi:signal peptidase I